MQRLTGETTLDTAATPRGLSTSFTLPGDYNLDGGSGVSMAWDADANVYLMNDMIADQIGANGTDALLAPSAGVASGGIGSDWVLVVTSQQGQYAVEGGKSDILNYCF